MPLENEFGLSVDRGENPLFYLVTAAHNAETTIARVIDSVISQSLHPVKWIIVDDRSEDATSDIIRGYQRSYPFIQLHGVRGENKKHSFSGQFRALNLAISKLDLYQAEFIGILDADIELPEAYFTRLLCRMRGRPLLGISGGRYRPYYNHVFHDLPVNSKNVSGCIQMFRMSCFQEIGAKFPGLQHGGGDTAMLIMARSKGWDVMSFEDLTVIHYGIVGGAAGNRLRYRFRSGLRFASLGYHPLYSMWLCMKRTRVSPWFLGSVFECAGFVAGSIRYRPPLLDQETLAFNRKEQLRQLFRKRSPFRSPGRLHKNRRKERENQK